MFEPRPGSYSRPQASAERLGDFAPDRHRFGDKRVLLTGEASTLMTANGRDCLLASLRLLPRICPDVTVALPDALNAFAAECRRLADTIAFGRAIEFADAHGYDSYDAVLSIGSQVRRDLPWTVINSHGWLARVSSGATSLPSICTQANPIAALAAACLGVGEVFKRLLRLRPERGPLFDAQVLSLYSYDAGDDPGPPLPNTVLVDVGIVGVGAIGNAIVYVLSRMPVHGRAWIVDAQRFEPENLGTCILLGPNDIGKPKAEVAAETLRGRLDVTAVVGSIQDVLAPDGQDVRVTPVILCGLDNAEARHAVQDLWPDLIIDGAMGDLACQVSRHPWGPDIACLRCLFHEVPTESAEAIASRLTGLHRSRIWGDENVITDADVAAAPPEKQAWLHQRQGQRICSVVAEAVARAMSMDDIVNRFAPSVPFVAALSGAMVVGELVKAATGWRTPLEPRYQIDLLWGPQRAQLLPQERRPDCICRSRRTNIEIARSHRD